jgi:hypothetical protein
MCIHIIRLIRHCEYTTLHYTLHNTHFITLPTSLPITSPTASPVTLGVCLEELLVQTVDANGEPSFVTGSPGTRMRVCMHVCMHVCIA